MGSRADIIEVVSSDGGGGYDLIFNGKRVGLCVQFSQASKLRYWMLANVKRTRRSRV